MIVSSLCEYYKIMSARGDVLPEGYSSVKINYKVSLTIDGEIDGIFSCGEPVMEVKTSKNKKGETVQKNVVTTVYPFYNLPFRSQKPGIEANIAEHRPLYIFGLDVQGGEFVQSDKAKKSHKAFKDATLGFFKDIQSPIAVALCKFAEKWNPEEQTQNAFLMQIVKGYSTSNFVFTLSGRPDILLHEDTAVKSKWEAEFERRNKEQLTDEAQCSVYGKQLPIARLHDKIKGVVGGQSSGCTLVCVNNTAEESYGKEQSFNSGISTQAMKEYTQALNFLLSSKKHRTTLDNMTVVHFALTKDESQYLQYVNDDIFAEASNDVSAADVEDSVKAVVEKLREGRKAFFDIPENNNIEYCIFGIVPNSSRISVRFFYRNTFGEIRKNAERYHNDFAICKSDKAPAIWRIKKELMPPKSNDKFPPDLGEALLRAMLQGTPFPQKLLQTVVRRIKTDVSINDIRAGLVKACLNRNNNNQEKIKMALDTQNKTPAYLCGRLFAVLEKIQQDSANGNLNKTIGDTYFSSACATPAVVLPKIMMLSRNHRAKLSAAAQVYYDNLCSSIISSIEEEFPKTLSLEEQGMFIIGYYHQKEWLYTKKENKTEEN